MSAPRAPRHASVDALRGWAVAAMLLVNHPGDWSQVYAPLRHAEWNGCTPTDLVFPSFLFLVGVSIALACGCTSSGQRGSHTHSGLPQRPQKWRRASLTAAPGSGSMRAW